MRVIDKKEYNSWRVTCLSCHSELEYTSVDIAYLVDGTAFVVCPVCRTTIRVENAPPLTSKTILYPEHFADMGANAVDIDDATIQRWVRAALFEVENSNDDSGEYAIMSSGNTLVFATKYEDEYAVYVAKDYREISISRD